ncbi:hypothetical protein GCWU000246_00517 [Jonquetella anthropi E3_33 E1]|nr:hypothetical protein GCWU000246_00517 [Jonquetella anthropi E3_33 E1]
MVWIFILCPYIPRSRARQAERADTALLDGRLPDRDDRKRKSRRRPYFNEAAQEADSVKVFNT